MSEPIRIIAWGNRGRRDDGAGLVLAERLEKRFAFDPDILVQQYHQLGPELVADLGRCRLAIFLDADVCETGDEVTKCRVRAATSSGLDTHYCSPETLLALGQSLGLAMPDAYLISIRAHDLDFGDQLSAQTMKGLLLAETVVIDLLDRAEHEQQEMRHHYA
jgi:hydrogenase maturation protease